MPFVEGSRVASAFLFEYRENANSYLPPLSGAAGNRTRVQTRNEGAFYMLILPLVVGTSTGTNAQTYPYLLKSRRLTGE